MLCLNNIASHGDMLNGLLASIAWSSVEWLRRKSMLCLNNIALHGVLLTWLSRKYEVLE